MFEVSFGKYKGHCHTPGLPTLVNEYVERARLAEQIDLSNSEGTAAFFAVGEQNAWPFLVVAQRCVPGEDSGFHPGALIVPETGVLLIGAGERILAYDLTEPSRIWEDFADTGFWSWDRFGEFVLMSAELELAAWNIRAQKLWTTYVEPPWSYTVEDATVHLDVMGKKSRFTVDAGPGKERTTPCT